MSVTNVETLVAADRAHAGRVWLVGLLAAAVAASANVVVASLARLLGLPLAVPIGPGGTSLPLPAAMVVTMCAAGAFLGTVAFLVLGRLGGPGSRRFLGVGGAFFLLSLAGPLSLAGTPVATRLTLALMHLVAATAIIGLLNRFGWKRPVAFTS